MIFVTVGTQFPFQRLVSGVDAWASRQPARPDMFAQVGEHDGKLEATEHEPFIDAVRCHDLICESDLVVAHAGVGTVLTALSKGTPVIVMPRRADLNEHRNDHQLDTVKWMRHLDGVTIVETVQQLQDALDAFVAMGSSPVALDPAAEPRLLAAISGFVKAAPTERRPIVFCLARAAVRAVRSLTKRAKPAPAADNASIVPATNLAAAAVEVTPESSSRGAADDATDTTDTAPPAEDASRRKTRLASAAAL